MAEDSSGRPPAKVGSSRRRSKSDDSRADESGGKSAKGKLPGQRRPKKDRTLLNVQLPLVIVCIGLVLGLGLQFRELESRASDIERALDEAREERAIVERAMEAMAAERKAIFAAKSELDAFKKQLVGRMDELVNVYQDEWLIDEAANYVRMAEQRLVLSNDPRGAATFLTAAADALDRTDIVGVELARQAITRDVVYLSQLGVENSSRKQAVSIIEVLLEQADELAMKPQAWEWTYRSGRDDAVDARAGQPTAQDSLSDGIIGFFYSLVTVRHHAEGRPLVADPQMRVYFEQNYRLLLHYLQMSALQNDSNAFGKGVDRTREWLLTHFSHDDVQVKTALAQLNALKRLEWGAAPEELKASRQAVATLHQAWKSVAPAVGVRPSSSLDAPVSESAVNTVPVMTPPSNDNAVNDRAVVDVREAIEPPEWTESIERSNDSAKAFVETDAAPSDEAAMSADEAPVQGVTE